MGTEDNALSEFFGVQSETTDESGSSNHLFSQLNDINFSEGNIHDIFAEPSVGSGSGGHLETHPELTASIGRNDYFNLNPEVVGGSRGPIDGNKHMVMHPNNPFYKSDLFSPTKKLRSVSSSSSSSLSSEDLFQVDAKGFSKSRLRTTSSLENELHTQPASKDDTNDIFSHKTSNSSELKNSSQSSTSTGQVSQATHELPTQSPPIQVMDRSGANNSQRIPSSVFDSNKSTTLDWSVASNESLFSIQLGNNSFSRDQFLVLGSELFKSEEHTKSNELLMFSPNPPVLEMETDKRSVELEKSGATGESVDEMTKDTTRATIESQSQEKSSSVALQAHSWNVSDESATTSSRSFAFPLKKKKKKKCAWPSCYCSNCSCTFCYHRWPSCYCSNCSWAFCCSWNCSKKRWCCHSCIILTGGLKDSSVKVDAEMPPQESVTPEVKSKSTCCNSFRCCLPCPSCCHFRCCSPCPSCCHFCRCGGCSCC